MLKKRAALFIIAAVTAFCQPAYADVIHMKDGKSYDGEILKDSGNSISIRVISGAEICELTLQRADIKDIERRHSSVADYVKLLSGTPMDNAAAVKNLSAWCSDNNYPELASSYRERATGIFKQHFLTAHPDQACASCNGSGNTNCAACQGSGGVDIPCQKCERKGWIQCPNCKGTNRIPCKNCKETGKVPSKKKKDEMEICPKCEGLGHNDCGKCENGKSQCPECKGKRTVKKKCSDCKGKGLVPCADCGGYGIAPAFRNDFERGFAALGSSGAEEVPTPGNNPPATGPNPAADNEAAEKTEKRVYSNIFARDAGGMLGAEPAAEDVAVYNAEPLTGKEAVVERLKDNTPLLVQEETSSSYKIRTESGIIGWVKKESTRPSKWEFKPCPICEGNGQIKCPACENGGITLEGRQQRCAVCGGGGKIACKQCRGRGTVRVK